MHLRHFDRRIGRITLSTYRITHLLSKRPPYLSDIEGASVMYMRCILQPNNIPPIVQTRRGASPKPQIQQYKRRATARLYGCIILYRQKPTPRIFLPTNNIPQIVQTCRGASPPKKYTQKTTYPIYATPVIYMG